MDKQVYDGEEKAYFLEGWLETPADRGKKKEAEQPKEIVDPVEEIVETKDPVLSMDIHELKKWFAENKPEIKFFKNAKRTTFLKLYEANK